MYTIIYTNLWDLKRKKKRNKDIFDYRVRTKMPAFFTLVAFLLIFALHYSFVFSFELSHPWSFAVWFSYNLQNTWFVNELFSLIPQLFIHDFVKKITEKAGIFCDNISCCINLQRLHSWKSTNLIRCCLQRSVIRKRINVNICLTVIKC